jgi:hypothetical protein
MCVESRKNQFHRVLSDTYAKSLVSPDRGSNRERCRRTWEAGRLPSALGDDSRSRFQIPARDPLLPAISRRRSDRCVHRQHRDIVAIMSWLTSLRTRSPATNLIRATAPSHPTPHHSRSRCSRCHALQTVTAACLPTSPPRNTLQHRPPLLSGPHTPDYRPLSSLWLSNTLCVFAVAWTVWPSRNCYVTETSLGSSRAVVPSLSGFLSSPP